MTSSVPMPAAADFSGCPGFVDMNAENGILRMKPSDDSVWGLPNEDGNPEGAYFLKIIATDPYAGRFEYVTEIYVS